MARKYTFGTVSHGTMRDEDLIDAFSSVNSLISAKQKLGA